jgi:hypothetical protein
MTECLICYSRLTREETLKNIVESPDHSCTHLQGLCHECFRKLRHCPLCRILWNPDIPELKQVSEEINQERYYQAVNDTYGITGTTSQQFVNEFMILDKLIPGLLQQINIGQYRHYLNTRIKQGKNFSIDVYYQVLARKRRLFHPKTVN